MTQQQMDQPGTPPRKDRGGYALFLGILSLFLLGPIAGPVAAVLGFRSRSAKGKIGGVLGVIGLVVSLFVIGGLFAVGSSPAGQKAALDALSPDTTLTFEIAGSATQANSITYITDGFGTAQENDASLPWTKTVTYKSGTLGVNISAQNAGSGTITCKISQDGKVIAHNESSGEYAIVDCAVS